MDDFFTARVEGYDEHMKNNIEGADVFYKYTASLLPTEEKANVLDLGCGTGLELEEYFSINPQARITGIDLTEAMLDFLKTKFSDKDITTICGSYFDVPSPIWLIIYIFCYCSIFYIIIKSNFCSFSTP